MKKSLLFTISILILSAAFAQTPQGFSYQAVVRNSSGSPIANQYVGVKIILQSASGTEYYSETQRPQTNNQGVFTLVIGNGTQFGSNPFSSIPWSNGDVQIKLEVDATGGTSYTPLGIATKLQSVPYALYSTGGTQGPAGNDGISINWRGTFISDPTSPSLNDAYYNSLLKKSYIYDKNNTWQILAQDGASGVNGTNGANGSNGISIVWKGTSASAPPSPSTNWAYYNSALKKSYVYDGSTWQILAQDGSNGTNGTNGSNGISLIWKGTLTADPASPSTNWAYYNSVQKKSYVYDGSAWQILAQDGMPISGTANQTLYYNNGWISSSNILNDNTNVGIGITPSTKLDINGGARFRGALYDGTSTSLTPGTANQILTSTGAGVLWKSPSTLSLASGTGTAGQLALWTGTNSGLQGVSNLTWGTNLQVRSISTAAADDPIMEVRNKNGLVVFAVYQSGVRMFVDGITAKGAKGGFAVGGLTSKASSEYFLITPDSARVRLKDPVAKGAKGGFAVGGLTSKGAVNSYLQLTPKNYFIGQDAGKNILNGEYNIFIGYQAGMNTTGYHDDMEPTDGDNNIFLGYHTGYSNTVGEKNVYIGAFSGENNVYGGSNTFLGSESGQYNTGYGNTFIGAQTGNAAQSNNTGYKNTYIGHWSGTNNTTGNGNVFIGRECGSGNTTGYNNVYIGHLAGHDNSTGYGNVFIGPFAGWYSNQSNKLIIHNSGDALASIPTNSLIYGDFAAKTLRINGNMGINYPGISGYGLIVETPTAQSEVYALYVVGNAYSTGTWNTSDERYKTNILPVKNALQNIVKLNGVTYDWNMERFPGKGFDKKKQIGLIAQDVEKIFPEMVKADEHGYKAINYSAFVPVLIESIKEQQKKIEQLEEKVKEVDAIKAELDAIKAMLKK